jgi:hypothetical protein
MKDDLFDTMDGDPLDDPPSAPAKSKRAWKRHYTKVPDEWVKRLHKARHPGSTWSLALELLYLRWKDGDEPIVVASKVIREAEVAQRSACDAVSELQRLGLVQVERAPGKAPRVTLLHVLPSA